MEHGAGPAQKRTPAMAQQRLTCFYSFSRKAVYAGYIPLVDKIWKRELGKMAQEVCEPENLSFLKPAAAMSSSNASTEETGGAC